MTSFIDYANSFITVSDGLPDSPFPRSEIFYLIRTISELSETDIVKKHMFHSLVLRNQEDGGLLIKSMLELYLFDKEGLRNLKYLDYNFIVKSSRSHFRLRDKVYDLQNRLFLHNIDTPDEVLVLQETKNFSKELEAHNYWYNNYVIVRRPEDYSVDQRLEIISQLNTILKPF